MTKKTGPTTVRWLAALPVMGGALLVAACSTSTTASGPASPTSPATHSPVSGSSTESAAVCQHVNSLRNSLTSLTHVSFSTSSASVITADLNNIQTQLTAIKAEGGTSMSGMAGQLQTSINQVHQAAKGLSSSPTVSQVQAVISALTHLNSTAGPMIVEMKAACP